MEDVLIECSPGISGDMLLGAFYDLGVPKQVIEKKSSWNYLNETLIFTYQEIFDLWKMF